MSKRSGWLLGIVALVLVGLLLACGTTYNSSHDGLLLVGSQYSGLIETFSFDIGNGKVSTITNSPTDTISDTCVLAGEPMSIVIDPAGAYAYTVINELPACNTATTTSKTGLMALKINSDGTTTPTGNLIAFNPETNIWIQGTTNPLPTVSVVPGRMVMDVAGKFLFVADRATTCYLNSTTPNQCATTNNGVPYYVPGAVSVFSISNGTITEVAGSPFYTIPPSTHPTTLPQSGLDIIGVAPTPTIYPAIGLNGVQNSVCSAPGLTPPNSEYLYAIDNLGSQVFEFFVNTTSGVLTLNLSPMQAQATDYLPAGIAVDPCDRFVYVSSSKNAQVSAYTICNGLVTQSINCPVVPDGSLQPVPGSPFQLSASVMGLGALAVDPFGNYLYVLGTTSNNVSVLKITPTSGAVLNANPPTVNTGVTPTSIAIRADDSWMFISNLNSPSSVSQYAITPSTGALSAEQSIDTDNYPWGVAVK